MRDLQPFGPRAFRVALDDAWIDDVGGRIALSDALARIDSVDDVLVTEVAVLLVCGSAPDERARHALATEVVRALAACRRRPLPSLAPRVIDVTYDGEDLEELARTLGISRDEIVRRHVASPFVVSFLGFAPGFGYLRGLDAALSGVARRSTPRPRVPAGAVAIAGGMSAIYPSASPGGWQLIGRAVDFDALATPLRPGEPVRFRAIDASSDHEAPARTPSAVVAGESNAMTVESVIGPALLVDGIGMRRLMNGAPPGGPLVVGLAHTAMRAVGGSCAGVILERYGATTLRSRCDRPLRIADETGLLRTINPGDALTFGAPVGGRVGYVAIEGGFAGDSVLGGRGTMLSIARGGHQGRVLRRGDRLPIHAGDPSSFDVRAVREGPETSQEAPSFRAHHGPDRSDARRALLACRIAHASDRTGTRLVPHAPHAMSIGPSRTTPMIVGAIQAPPSGELIVLGPDHPITGGYPVVGVLDRDACDPLFALPLGSEVTLEIE